MFVLGTLIKNLLIHFIKDPPNRAGELFLEGMKLYLDKHDSKKFHDPVAAVCHIHPEIGTWFKGTPYRDKGKWGIVSGGNSDILVDIDREKFWKHIYEFN